MPGEASLRALKGAGPRTIERLTKLGVHSAADLLLLLPHRFEDRTRIAPIGGLVPGEARVVEGEITASQVVMRRRRALLCTLSDGTGRLNLRFFHFGDSFQRSLIKGARVRCFGEPRGVAGALEMVHPEFTALGKGPPPPLADSLTPIYPSTDGLSQATVRSLVEQARASGAHLPELLPDAVRKRFSLMPLDEALERLHAPPPGGASGMADTEARERLAFEELASHLLSLRQRHADAGSLPAPALTGDASLSDKLLASLAFELTGAQARVLGEIRADLANTSPMQRLLQGDVGSGKTIVAALTSLAAIEAGYQAVLMAPTELLAEQHRRSFADWFEPLGVPVAWLSGSMGAAERRASLAAIADGSAAMVVGTHALFQESVEFAKLGLAIIDEQHRFGVHQRMALGAKSERGGAHQLVMTATPIPRTLAMTAFAHLDLSVLDELPPGRTPVSTAAIPNARRDEVIERIALACGRGQQAYWVCTLIEESDALEASAAEATAQMLSEQLDGVRVGLVHGRMRPAEKEQVMRAFEQAELDLLVATTVIEVGVNVPNASLMVIENAERLGLAQLHQLRGRVGRGAAKSACALLYEPPLSLHARSRLDIMRETNDGFRIAERDLEIRGPGELLGTRQTGLAQLRVADLALDDHLLDSAREAAELLLEAPAETRAALVQRWVGEAERYAQA